MEKHIVFNYKISTKYKVKALIFGFLMIIPACWLSLAVMFPLAIFSEKILPSKILGIIPFIVFIIFIFLIIVDSFRKSLRTLTITTDEIAWETSLRKAHSIKKENITKINWKYNLVLLNQRVKIFTDSLSKKDKILFAEALSKWLPDDALDFDSMQFRKNREAYLPNRDFGKQPICAESSKRKSSIIRGAVIAFSIVLIPLAFYVFSMEREALGGFIFLSAVIFTIFFIMWSTTAYQIIQIDNSGIIYQKGRKSHTYGWQDIEVIAVEVRYKQFLIWRNNKQSKMSFSRIKEESLNEVANAIFQQTLIHDIPFGVL